MWRSKEIALLAMLTAVAAAGRVAFFFLPGIKPILPIIILTGAAYGKKAGAVVGMLSALLSNFIFGQGPWTPVQMFAMGLLGFLAGLWFARRDKAPGALEMAVFGALTTFFLYGGILNAFSAFSMLSSFTWAGVLAVYAAGLPFDAAHAAGAAVFLLVLQPVLYPRLLWAKKQYDLRFM